MSNPWPSVNRTDHDPGPGPQISKFLSAGMPDKIIFLWHVRPQEFVYFLRAVDREFNYNFGTDLGLLGSRRGLNGRGAPVGFIWADFQLKRSHGDPFRDQNHVFGRPVLPWC